MTSDEERAKAALAQARENLLRRVERKPTSKETTPPPEETPPLLTDEEKERIKKLELMSVVSELTHLEQLEQQGTFFEDPSNRERRMALEARREEITKRRAA